MAANKEAGLGVIALASPRPSSRRWPQAFLIYFGAFTFSIGAPIYGFIQSSPVSFDIDRSVGVWFICALSVAPAVGLVLLRSLVGRFARILDGIIYSATTLSALRQIQLHFLPTTSLSTAQRIMLILVLLGLAVALIWVLRMYVTLYMTFLGALSLVLPAQFMRSLPSSHRSPVGAVSPSGTQAGGPSNTVFVFVFDELSLNILLNAEGDIDRTAFPNFADFADQSVWFRQAVANYPLTELSINSMLTGEYVRQVATDVTAIGKPNLLSVMVDHRYKVGFYSRSLLCGVGEYECLKLRADRLGRPGEALFTAARFYLPEAIQFWLIPGLGTRPRLEEGLMLSHMGGSVLADPGRMSFIHMLISHYPFILTAGGQRIAFSDYLHADFRPGVDVDRALRLYKEQARYLDRQFGGFIQGLKRSGAWQRAVIVVTADHGTCWAPGCMPRYGRLTAVEPSLVRVPMIVHAPDLKPAIVDGDYQNVDLFPTLLQLLNIETVVGEFEGGRSAFAPALTARRTPFFVNGIQNSVDLNRPPRRVEVGSR